MKWSLVRPTNGYYKHNFGNQCLEFVSIKIVRDITLCINQTFKRGSTLVYICKIWSNREDDDIGPICGSLQYCSCLEPWFDACHTLNSSHALAANDMYTFINVLLNWHKHSQRCCYAYTLYLYFKENFLINTNNTNFSKKRPEVRG